MTTDDSCDARPKSRNYRDAQSITEFPFTNAAPSFAIRIYQRYSQEPCELGFWAHDNPACGSTSELSIAAIRVLYSKPAAAALSQDCLICATNTPFLRMRTHFSFPGNEP